INRLFDVKVITTNYTPTADDYVLVCNPTAAITITLPNPSAIVGSGETKEFIIVNVSANTVTVNTTDVGSVVLSQNQKLHLFTEGTNWFFGNYWAKEANNADTVDTFHASQTPAANTIPVAGANALIANAWLANSIREFENPIDTVAYYNQNGVDYPLAVGEVAKISFSAVTSQPLRIATPNNSEYLLWIIPSNPGATTGGAGNVCIYPNNTTYANAFIYSCLYRNAAGVGSAYSTASSFVIGWNWTHLFCVIRNLTQIKSIIGIYDSYGDANGYPCIAVFASAWRDTTTAWTSLGTIVWLQASSGYILVKRIM
ncbi:MAG: hypothetical protein QXJ20_02695, partial [Candidatus Aenigmatarchaeota archaeon]